MVAVLTLAGCVSTGIGSHAALDQLMIDDGSGPVPYLSRVSLPAAEANSGPELPIIRWIRIAYFTDPATRWLQSFDFDGDKALDQGELTHAWLVRAAETTAGRNGQDAKLYLEGRETPVQGLSLSAADGRRVRAALDRVAAATIARVEVILAEEERRSGAGAVRDIGGY